MRHIAIISALALCLAGCGTATTPPPASNATAPAPASVATPTPVPASTVDAVTADAMYAAEALYNVPAHAYVTADAKGLLPAATKATVKPYLTAAYDALKKARLSYVAYQAFGKVADASAFWTARAAVKSNADEANNLIPK